MFDTIASEITPGDSVTPPQKTASVGSPSNLSFKYRTFVGNEISDNLIQSCADLFSNNYGIWGESALSVSKFIRPGNPVKMNGKKLRERYISDPEKTVLVTCFHEERLVGHAFATIWDYEDGTVGWITQLVVDVTMRKRHVATRLLQTLTIDPCFRNINAVGLASSHPVACEVLAKCALVKIDAIDTMFIHDNAQKILDASTVEYLKAAMLRGSLFQENPDPGVISSVDTQFFVDHKEPLEVLENFKTTGRGWCLGELVDGHEFLVIVPFNKSSVKNTT